MSGWTSGLHTLEVWIWIPLLTSYSWKALKRKHGIIKMEDYLSILHCGTWKAGHNWIQQDSDPKYTHSCWCSSIYTIHLSLWLVSVERRGCFAWNTRKRKRKRAFNLYLHKVKLFSILTSSNTDLWSYPHIVGQYILLFGWQCFHCC